MQLQQKLMDRQALMGEKKQSSGGPLAKGGDEDLPNFLFHERLHIQLSFPILMLTYPK